jgi:hypothetical protein
MGMAMGIRMVGEKSEEGEKGREGTCPLPRVG